MEDYILDYPRHECSLKKKRKKVTRVSAFEKFKNQFLISDKNFRGNWYLRCKGSVLLEIIKHKKSNYWYIVHPFSLYHLWWECFMVILFIFSLVFTPFRGCFLNSFMAKYNHYFKKSQKHIINGLKIEFFLNTIFIIDSIGFFFTGYYIPEKQMTEFLPKKLFRRHICTFVTDVLTYTSVDSLILIFGGIEAYATMSDKASKLIQIVNLIQFVRFRTYFMYCYSYRKFKIFSLIRTRLFIIFFFYYLTLHWTVYFVLIIPEMINGDNLYLNTENKTISWVQSTEFLTYDLQNQYFLALLRSLRIIHFEATQDWEEMYSLGDYLCGIIVNVWSTVYWTFVIIYITEVIVADNALTMKVNFILQQLNAYMKWKDLPGDLKKRLYRFYLHRFYAHYFNHKVILGKLTESLRKEISMYTCHTLLNKTELFQIIPKNVVAKLVQNMHRELYFPNDVIIQGNTFGECMYFISSGTVSVSTVAGKEISRLKDGDYFGEIALIAQNRRRTATVTTITITEVYRLELSDFKSFTDEYPEFYSRIEKNALDRYNTLLVAEREEI